MFPLFIGYQCFPFFFLFNGGCTILQFLFFSPLFFMVTDCSVRTENVEVVCPRDGRGATVSLVLASIDSHLFSPDIY